MKSTLLTMTASLCGLALLVGAALAGVNILTEKPIAEAQAEARRQAIAAVLPEFDNNPSEEAIVTPDGLTLFPATKTEKKLERLWKHTLIMAFRAVSPYLPDSTAMAV